MLFCLELLGFSFLSAYFIWLQTSKYGIGLSPDSTTYLRWSEAISKEGFSFVLKNKYATFPPLYPVVLAIFSSFFHVDPMLIARWFNILLSFCFTFLSIFLCRKLTKSLVILFVFGLFVSFSRPLNLVFSHAWSEPLFIFFLLLIAFFVGGTGLKHLILMGFFSALAILTRYAGVAVVPIVCLYIFISKYEISAKVKRCFCYALLPTLTYITYLIRNYYFTKTLMGPRTASNTGLISNCDRAFSTVALWFSGSFYFSAILLFFVFGAFVWNYRKELFKFGVGAPGVVKFSFCFVLVYSAFIIVTSTTTAYDLINDRLMAPVFLFALLLLFSLVVFICKTSIIEKSLLYLLCSVLIVCTVISFAKALTKDINFRKNHGVEGYNSELWQENNLVKYLRANKLNLHEKIFTNDIYSFFIIDKKIKTLSIPLQRGGEITNLEDSVVVYFFNNNQSGAFTLNELQTICEMRSVVKNMDGGIFKVAKCAKP